MKGKEPVQVDGQSNSTPHGQTIVRDSYHMIQHEVIHAKQEQNHKVVNQPDVTQHEVDRHIRMDVPNFDGEQRVHVFFDWKHHVKAFCKWHEVPEGCKH